MTVSFKDSFKFVGIIITVFCAVLVCNLFLNYDIDLRAIGSAVTEQEQALYKALKLNNTVVCSVTGGCLVLTSVVLLIFYIGHYIAANSSKFGILKALGYGSGRISASCAVFGACVFFGAAAGYAVSWTILPSFYRIQNSDALSVNVNLRFHPALFILLVVVPTALFCALSVLIAYLKLNASALSLIRGDIKPRREKKRKERKAERNFLTELAFNVFCDRKSLIFFVGFGSFCFSAMTQMGLSMRDYASDMMGAMILIIGLVLAAMSLLLALSTVVKSNSKTLAMLKVNGYSLKESGSAVLGLYHIPAAIGFAIGCVYQYGLLNIMVNIVFSSFDDVPHYSFDWAAFGICLAAFMVAYEIINLIFTVIIGKTPLKSVMSE